jgi:hypothetical protein
MNCFFCKTNDFRRLHMRVDCIYFICDSCLDKMTSYIPEEQKWKLIQMRGDKISETL